MTTIHGFSDAAILPAYTAARSNYVSISDSARSPLLDYVATIHHGIDVAEFDFRGTSDDDLVVFGRIHPDKGTAEAIQIARRADRRLIICGIVQDEHYFDSRVRPHLDQSQVVFRGSVGPAARSEVVAAQSLTTLCSWVPRTRPKTSDLPDLLPEPQIHFGNRFIVDAVDDPLPALANRPGRVSD